MVGLMERRPRSRCIWLLAVTAVLLCVVGCASASTPVPSANSWRFVIFGDTRGDFDPALQPPCDMTTATGVSKALPQIAAKITQLKPDFVLHVGDLVCGDLYHVAEAFHQIPPGSAIPYARQFQAFKTAIRPITSGRCRVLDTPFP